MAKVADFKPARVNANQHTARGLGALTASVQTYGWIDAMTTAADGEMISGSARLETAAQVFGTDAEPIVVHSDGTRPIIHVRDDIPNAADKRAIRLALDANRIHELDWLPDVEVLAGLDVDVLEGLWTPDELSELGQQWADEQAQQTAPVTPEVARQTLAERFLVPPFSVLDARQGYWQARKSAWLALGIQSELGRGENALDMSAAMAGVTDPEAVAAWNKQRRESPRNGGTLGAIAPNEGGDNGILARTGKYAGRANATPGGAPRPVARLGPDGHTQRGDGKGRTIGGRAADNGGASLPLDRAKNANQN